MSRDDPVKAVLGDREDLYDVASWDVRSRLDGVAVGLYLALATMRTRLLVVLGLVLFTGQLGTILLLVLQQPVLGVLGLVSVVPALALAAYLWYDDPTRREPLEPLAVTFALGIVLAAIAAVVNTALFSTFAVVPVVGLPLFFFLVVGPIEEGVKWLAVRAHAYEAESFDAVVDGAVYGAVAGLGFATIENVIYIVQVFVQTAGTTAATQAQSTVAVATSRAFVGPGHVIWSALAGYYLGLAKFNPDRRGPIVVKGLLVAALAHAAYNTLVTFTNPTGLELVATVVLYDGLWLAVLYRKISRYRSYYHRAMAADGGRG